MDSLGTAAAIDIRVNGDSRRVPVGTTIADLLTLLEIQGDRVAVELDRVIVRRPEWSATVVGPASNIEVVHFVGGG